MEGALLHEIRYHEREVMQDLRWLVADAPYLEAQCRECGNSAERVGHHRVLPKAAARYCMHWGVWLQEVLLDRSGRYNVRSCTLRNDSLSPWAQELASKIVMQCYRKDSEAGLSMRAGWLDLWALVQESRLSMVLDSIIEEAS